MRLLVLVLFLAACSTYRDDLDRAMVHYHANEYDKALALLELLESDIDSLSPSERAQYSYYRGLSHYRLDQRQDARHWLGVAAARNKVQQGALSGEERKRVDDTLGELNEARWGGAKTPGADKVKCVSDADCGEQKCVDEVCKGEGEQAQGGSPSAPAN